MGGPPGPEEGGTLTLGTRDTAVLEKGLWSSPSPGLHGPAVKVELITAVAATMRAM